MHCPVCGDEYADDFTECYRKPDTEDGLVNGWCATARLKWSE
jgi:hypothetical protein